MMVLKHEFKAAPLATGRLMLVYSNVYLGMAGVDGGTSLNK